MFLLNNSNIVKLFLSTFFSFLLVCTTCHADPKIKVIHFVQDKDGNKIEQGIKSELHYTCREKPSDPISWGFTENDGTFTCDKSTVWNRRGDSLIAEPETGVGWESQRLHCPLEVGSINVIVVEESKFGVAVRMSFNDLDGQMIGFLTKEASAYKAFPTDSGFKASFKATDIALGKEGFKYKDIIIKADGWKMIKSKNNYYIKNATFGKWEVIPAAWVSK